MLFAATWKVLPGMRTDATTFFASKDLDFLQREVFGENCKFVGRWHNMANLTGVCVFDAKDSEAAAKFLWKWTEENCEVEIVPVVTDEEAREIILRRKPDFVTPMQDLNAPLEEGETLFWVSWKVYAEKKTVAFKQWGMMTEEEELASYGKCRHLGRFHNPAEGTGFAISAAKSAMDLQQAIYPWLELMEVKVVPVVDDVTALHVIQSKEGFQIKSDALQKKINEMKV